MRFLLQELGLNDQGQDIAEYAVMLPAILVIVVGTIRLIGSNANKRLLRRRQSTAMSKFQRGQRGNPNVGKPIQVPLLITEFEQQVERLGLTNAEFGDSAELRIWCHRNRNRVYVPE